MGGLVYEKHIALRTLKPLGIFGSITIPKKKSAPKAPKTPLKIISLGGLGEIGKNLTVYEYKNDILLVDCGMAFPDEETPGVDIVIPDFSYLVLNKEKIRGLVVFTWKTKCKYILHKDIHLESISDDRWVVYDLSSAIYWLIEYLKRKW